VDPLFCPHCGGEIRCLAVIKEAPVIERILRHRSTIAVIFQPLPRFAGPVSSPLPLAEAKLASIKHSDSLTAPSSRKALARSMKHISQYISSVPLLEAAMNGLIVRLALRKRMPLVQDSDPDLHPARLVG